MGKPEESEPVRLIRERSMLNLMSKGYYSI